MCVPHVSEPHFVNFGKEACGTASLYYPAFRSVEIGVEKITVLVVDTVSNSCRVSQHFDTNYWLESHDRK